MAALSSHLSAPQQQNMAPILSQIDPSYTQICLLGSGVELREIQIILNTIKNVWAIRDTEKSTYILKKYQGIRWEIYKDAIADENRLLGYCVVTKVFYGVHKNSVEFYRMISSFQAPLTMREMVEMQGHYRDPKKASIAHDLTPFQFAPPPIVCDAGHDPIILDSPVKYLPQTMELAPDEFLNELIQGNQGLFFGHTHTQVEGITKFLSNKMKQLKEFGVKHVYLELPASRLHQAFTLFNAEETGNTGKALVMLKESLTRVDVEGLDPLLKLCLYAKMNEIEVWPVDMTFDFSKMTSPELLVDQRDQVMTKNTRYYAASLQEGEKYIGLFGLAHHQVATSLSIPNIKIWSCNSEGESCNSEEAPVDPELFEMQKSVYEQLSKEKVVQMEEGHDLVLIIDTDNKTFIFKRESKE